MDDGTASVIEDVVITTDREIPDHVRTDIFKHLAAACLIEALHPDRRHRLEHIVVRHIDGKTFLDAAIVTISRTDHNNSPFIGCKTNGMFISIYLIYFYMKKENIQKIQSPIPEMELGSF